MALIMSLSEWANQSIHCRCDCNQQYGTVLTLMVCGIVANDQEEPRSNSTISTANCIAGSTCTATPCTSVWLTMAVRRQIVVCRCVAQRRRAAEQLRSPSASQRLCARPVLTHSGDTPLTSCLLLASIGADQCSLPQLRSKQSVSQVAVANGLAPLLCCRTVNGLLVRQSLCSCRVPNRNRLRLSGRMPCF